MQLTKDALKPGTYRKPGIGSDGVPFIREFTVTPNDVAEMDGSIRQLTERGYRIPFWKEHPPLDAKTGWKSLPVKAASKAKLREVERDPFFAGWVEGSKIGDDGTLHLELDVDDELGDKLIESGSLVSPQFGKFELSKDEVIPMAIHHLAMTRSPVSRNQTDKFLPSQKPKAPTGVDESTKIGEAPIIQMSLTDLVAESAVALSSTDLVMPTPQQPQTPNDQGGQTPQTSTPDCKQRFIEAMKALGVMIDPNSPMSADEQTLGRIVAMLAEMTGNAAAKQTQAGPTGGTGKPQYQEQATVVAMSTTSTETPTPPAKPDDQIIQMSQALVLQDGRLKAAEATNARLVNEITAQHRRAFSDRIQRLQSTGRITSETATELSNLVGAYQFSLTESAGPNQLELSLGIYEKLPANCVMPMTGNQPTQMSQMIETPVSTSQFFAPNAEPDDARVQQIMNELFASR